jgi:hypothetical protein
MFVLIVGSFIALLQCDDCFVIAIPQSEHEAVQ